MLCANSSILSIVSVSPAKVALSIFSDSFAKRYTYPNDSFFTRSSSNFSISSLFGMHTFAPPYSKVIVIRLILEVVCTPLTDYYLTTFGKYNMPHFALICVFRGNFKSDIHSCYTHFALQITAYYGKSGGIVL